jgi:predicted ATPase
MRLKEIQLRNYKKFTTRKTLHFKRANKYDPNSDITLIVGNNGSGKSSILQAIVLTTATASRNGFNGQDFDWPGFEYRHIQTGRLPCDIKCTYEFSESELEATAKYAEELQDIGIKLYSPSTKQIVTLQYDYQKAKSIAPSGATAYYQFSGYQYAKKLTSLSTSNDSLFDKVGNIYWYTEQRTSYSISKSIDNEALEIDWIRNFLSSAYAFHIALTEGKRELGQGQIDFYEKLHSLYKKVFPNRSFVGAAPNFDARGTLSAPDFFLTDGQSQYEISEMSAGERAIFPILLDFARWNINNSIIIIDEVELHLHSSLQQAFVRALSKIGSSNQFILTTHSETIVNMFEESNIIRL